ncbi:FUSC family protein [Actinomycetospora termitidis]|uniref:FUSC family protein n=1 Tax=Actinomycetospora termitidis TaxID=3053470 RepID=A0ABT7MCP9_9PSEU|nr:FUSC family protein [Actinomycetospora sp. Odt1-22]MDL5157767.1 FUSC family protein [Actinomycetospora sp. Odt1-22]
MLHGLPARAWDRVRQASGRIVLDGAVAIVAFLLAQLILRQPAPIFAPIAAVVCLTDSPADRGPRALRLLLGVVAGVVVGELAKLVIGSGWLQVGAAVVVGMLVVTLGSINPLTLLQSGIAALLVVGIGSSQAGWTRLASALIGGALALLVSQVLVSPSPTRQFGDAVSTALRGIADGLDDVVGALRSSGSDAADRARRAAEGLRGGHGDVASLLDARTTSNRLARTTLRGRRERASLEAMLDRFVGLEYVHAGSVLLARTAAEVTDRGDPIPDDLTDGVEALAGAVRSMADHPRQTDPPASTRDVHTVAGEIARTDPDAHRPGAARLATQLHLLAEDVTALTSTPSSAGASP